MYYSLIHRLDTIYAIEDTKIICNTYYAYKKLMCDDIK